MTDLIGLTVSSDGITQTLQSMLSRAGLVRGWLNRVGYPMVVEAQRLRWVSEGSSEGYTWKPLKESYAIRKLKKFASFKGGGTKMLIATGRLVDSVTGDAGSEHYKLVEEKRLEVGSLVPYAKYVDDQRTIVKMGDATMQGIVDALTTYLQGSE